MKRIRYETGVCPRCGSLCTGRLVKGNPNRTTFGGGSPLIFVPETDGYNLACAACGVRWSGNAPIKMVEKEEIDRIATAWDYMQQTQDSYSEEEEQEILETLAEELGMQKPKKKPSKIKQFLKFTDNLTVNAFLTPVKSVSKFAGDLGDLAALHTGKEQDEDDYPHDNE